MIKISLKLPEKYRLNITLGKRPGPSIEEPFFPDMEKISRTKRGNKISLFFKHFFEHSRIKRVLGTNLAFLVVVSSLLPVKTIASSEAEELNFTQTPVVLTTEKGLQAPLEKVKITQGYRFYHPGVDYDGITGDRVRPIMAGRVEHIEYSRFAYGNSVIINHGNGVTSLYAHLSKIEVKEGEPVTNETKLGEVGATGRAFGDHLHLEVYENGKPINPLTILPH